MGEAEPEEHTKELVQTHTKGQGGRQGRPATAASLAPLAQG